ncbi:MAG: glycosyltransferase family 25 protein [Thermoplasmata archaeon]
MRFYVISMSQAVERREKLKTQFKQTYSNFEIIEGVDGKNLIAAEYFEKIKCYYDKYLRIVTPGEVGCALSHTRVYETFLKSSDNYALILEDDVIGTDKDIDEIIIIADRIKKEISKDFLWIVGGMEGLDKSKLFLETTRVSNVFLVKELSRRYLYRTVCYVITKNVARRILEIQRSCLHVADEWDKIVPSDVPILYSEILKHPMENNSYIETERNKLKKAYKEIISKSLKMGLDNKIHSLKLLIQSLFMIFSFSRDKSH